MRATITRLFGLAFFVAGLAAMSVSTTVVAEDCDGTKVRNRACVPTTNKLCASSASSTACATTGEQEESTVGDFDCWPDPGTYPKTTRCRAKTNLVAGYEVAAKIPCLLTFNCQAVSTGPGTYTCYPKTPVATSMAATYTNTTCTTVNNP